MTRSSRLLVAILLGLAAGAAAAATAVEYYHAAYGHYFVTASPTEIGALDAGTIPGWTRTSESFAVYDLGSPGTANVCRFWSARTFAPKSSHFYTPVAAECAFVKADPTWTFEGEVFGLAPSDAAGSCAGGTIPLYRLYNDGHGGAPNHRYTTQLATRSAMLSEGWVPEGAGDGVIGCVPGTPPAGTTVVAAGDIAQCLTGSAVGSGASRTAVLVSPGDAVVLVLGDAAYENGTPEEYAGCYGPTWGAFTDRTYPAPGNHDYNTPGAAGYFGYFGPRAGPDHLGYYSFDHAGWHFVALNSLIDVTPQSAQYAWLAADLAQSDALCTIAYWHYPAFNSGAVYGSVPSMRPMFALLQSAGVEIVLSGHEHVYERFAPQRADGTADPLRGLQQFVVGTGGHERNPFGAPLPNSEFRTNAGWGVLRLTLAEGRYSWQFVPVNGAPLDAGSAVCHR